MDKNKIFIPFNIEQTSVYRSSYIFSPKKSIMLMLMILPSIFWIPYTSSLTPGSPMGLILGVLVYVVGVIFFTRFVIFEEGTWKKVFQEREINKLSSYKYFWGIDKIDSNGMIHYKLSVVGGVKVSFVVKLIQGYSIGRGTYFEDRFKRSIQTFINDLCRYGYTIKKYTYFDKKTVPEGIQKMYEDIKLIKDDLTREIALEHVNNLALRAKTSQRILVHYFEISTTDPIQAKVSYDELTSLLNELNSQRFFKVCKILDKKEVEDFIIDYLNIGITPSDVGEYDYNLFRRYGEIVRLFDANGNEEWVEAIDFARINENGEFEFVINKVIDDNEDVNVDKDVNENVNKIDVEALRRLSNKDNNDSLKDKVVEKVLTKGKNLVSQIDTADIFEDYDEEIPNDLYYLDENEDINTSIDQDIDTDITYYDDENINVNISDDNNNDINVIENEDENVDNIRIKNIDINELTYINVVDDDYVYKEVNMNENIDVHNDVNNNDKKDINKDEDDLEIDIDSLYD